MNDYTEIEAAYAKYYEHVLKLIELKRELLIMFHPIT
jgi:hypothetical protein